MKALLNDKDCTSSSCRGGSDTSFFHELDVAVRKPPGKIIIPFVERYPCISGGTLHGKDLQLYGVFGKRVNLDMCLYLHFGRYSHHGGCRYNDDDGECEWEGHPWSEEELSTGVSILDDATAQHFLKLSSSEVQVAFDTFMESQRRGPHNQIYWDAITGAEKLTHFQCGRSWWDECEHSHSLVSLARFELKPRLGHDLCSCRTFPLVRRNRGGDLHHWFPCQQEPRRRPCLRRI